MKYMPEKTNDHRGCLACGFPFWDDLTPDEHEKEMHTISGSVRKQRRKLR